MRISDWSSDVCSSDLKARQLGQRQSRLRKIAAHRLHCRQYRQRIGYPMLARSSDSEAKLGLGQLDRDQRAAIGCNDGINSPHIRIRSEAERKDIPRVTLGHPNEAILVGAVGWYDGRADRKSTRLNSSH